MDYVRTICVDFDGVIHSYASGFQGPDVITDPPVPGAFEWLEAMLNDPGFRPVIYSSRSKFPAGVAAMVLWFQDHGFSRVNELEFPTKKPAAFLTVDDRAICFRGTYPSLQDMADFRAWNK